MEGIVGGKYNIVETVCPGRAFRAIDLAGKQQYFVKRFDPDDGSFEDEKQNLTTLISPHMPQFVEAFSEADGGYIVTEWIKGITLADYVNIEGPADPEDTGELIIKICEALSFFHWNRKGAMAFIDLKPSNIMLRDYSGNDVRRVDICLVDLEAARSVEPAKAAEPVPVSDALEADMGARKTAEAAESSGVAAYGGSTKKGGAEKKTRKLGSPYYIAPEVLFGRICIQSDIYSIGAIAGFLLTGREDHPSAYSLRGFWREFMTRCTEPDPGKRFANVREVIDGIRAFLRTEKAAGERKDPRNTNVLRLLKSSGGDKKAEKGPGPVKVQEKGSGKVPEHKQGSDRITQKGDNGYGPAAGIFLNEAINFRRACVMVEGNPCFVSEMGMAAAASGLSTGVFSLSERGRRNLEYYFTGHMEDLAKVAEGSLYPYVFDHRSMYLHSREDWTEKGLLKLSGEGNRLYTGTFKQCLELPLRRSEDVRRFVEWSITNFDLTLMNVERGDDPALVNTLLESCSYVIATPDSNVEDMESFRNYYLTLAQSGKLIYSKVRFVAWDYTDREADRNSLFKVVGKDKYLGEVFKSEIRNKRKNRVEDAGSVLDDLPGRQYEEILQKLISREASGRRKRQ